MKQHSVFLLIGSGCMFVILSATNVFARDFDIMDWISGHSCRTDTSGHTYSCPINRTAPRRGDQLTGVVVNMIEPGGWAQVCATRHDDPGQVTCTGKIQTSDRKIVFRKMDLDEIRKVPPGWGTYLHVEVGTSSSLCKLSYNCMLGYGVQWDTSMPTL